MSEKKNGLYWAYNLPLQVWPVHADEDDDSSLVTGCRILNYMPRRDRSEELMLADVIGNQTRQEFFEQAALVLENLARLMREAGADPSKHVYYPDEGMQP